MEEIQENLNNIEKVMQAVKDWFAEEGYRCNVDEDGDFYFKYQGKNILFIKDVDDPKYYRLVMPNIYDIEEESETYRIEDICNDISAEIKCVKAYVVKNNKSVWLSIEFLLDPENVYLKSFFQAYLDIMLGAYFKIADRILNNNTNTILQTK